MNNTFNTIAGRSSPRTRKRPLAEASNIINVSSFGFLHVCLFVFIQLRKELLNRDAGKTADGS